MSRCVLQQWHLLLSFVVVVLISFILLTTSTTTAIRDLHTFESATTRTTLSYLSRLQQQPYTTTLSSPQLQHSLHSVITKLVPRGGGDNDDIDDLNVSIRIVPSKERRQQQQQQEEEGASKNRKHPDAPLKKETFESKIMAGGSTGSSTTVPLCQETKLDHVREAPLLHDIELLSHLLSNLVYGEDATIHDLYEYFRLAGLERASHPNSTTTNKEDDPLRRMIQMASMEHMTADQAVGVMRTFSIMLNLVNSAEVTHRTRVLQQIESSFTIEQQLQQQQQQQSSTDRTTDKSSSSSSRRRSTGPLPMLEDSIRGTMDALLLPRSSSDQQPVATAQQIYDQLLRQKVEIVLTAHPTQVQRKSLLRKYRQISELLQLQKESSQTASSTTGYAQTELEDQLARIISSIWGADEIRRSKPTPQQEAAGGNAVIETVLWDAVPTYLRKLHTQCHIQLHKKLPIDCCPIKFASWIGGDRDGNPNVTPEVTREVVLQQRLRATRLFTKDMYQLLSELGISCRFSVALEELAASIPQSPHALEKYRRVIGHLIDRLVKTSRDIEHELATITTPEHTTSVRFAGFDELSSQHINDVEPILDEQDLLRPLMIMHDSLVESGFALVADGLLVDIIRRVTVFGLSLVPLDIREESTKHTEALDAVTRYLGIGSYREWSEDARLSWLTSELSSKRPLFTDRDLRDQTTAFDASVTKTLRTFATASTVRPTALGAYVISQAQTASDVLAVMLLQKQFGMTASNGNMMRVVPLFETLNDLQNAPSVLETLFRIPFYIGAVKSKQEVMVGYSDSAKDAGRLAACWALYYSQEDMANVATKYSIELTFFHGKGGTVGRGGNPSVYRAIMSHPPNTINGRFRVTEQGEMITQNFGTIDVAERTLDIYTAAVCRESFVTHVEPSRAWREQMDRIAEVSCADYREMVSNDPRFVPYFRMATPELELGVLNIGSRPAKRNPKGGVESLRAIPWTFAWTQTRSHLSSWLGVGKALTTTDPDVQKTLRQMYKDWPWFRETIDLLSMIVSKTDFSISKNYDDQLVDSSTGLLQLGEEIRDKLVETRKAILDVTESKDVAGAHVALQRASSRIRHPYIDPVNVIQAELLKRYRTMEDKKEPLSDDEEETKQKLKDALILSINAIAQGMKNSG